MKYTITVTDQINGMTIKQYLTDILRLSRTNIIALKTETCGITVNNEHVTVRHILRTGEMLQLTLPEKSHNVQPINGHIDIVYRDEYLYAVHKVQGMPTHPDRKHRTDTLGNLIVAEFGADIPLHIVTRLDKDTEGLVLGALDRITKRLLTEQLQNNQIHKTYIALCKGTLPNNCGQITLPLLSNGQRTVVNNKGKSALTNYKVLKHSNNISLVQLNPVTGRTHQLRAHLSAIGCPIVGDCIYGDGNTQGNTLKLFMQSLQFVHPHSGQSMDINLPLPQWAHI